MHSQTQSDYNFKTALVDFNKLKQQKLLPFKMLIKLQYLENKILGREIRKQEYRQLPEYELESLEQCDKQSQMTLFSSIVKCLCGKQVIVYFKDQKSYIKKEESFSLWTKCYISCDSTFLYIKKKANKKTNYYEFRIRLLKVSKKYLEYKGRLCFGLMYENKKYMLGFEQETACERIFKTLKQLVRENHPEYENNNNNNVNNNNNSNVNNNNITKKARSQQKVASFDNNNNTNSSNISDKFQSVVGGVNNSNDRQSALMLSFHTCNQDGKNSVSNLSGGNVNNNYNNNYKKSNFSYKDNSQSAIMQFQQQQQQTQQKQLQLKQKRQQQILNAIKQQIQRQNLSNDSSYKLIKNLQIGRILVDCNFDKQQQSQKQVKTKTSVILALDTMGENRYKNISSNSSSNSNSSKDKENNTLLFDLPWILQLYIQMKSWNLQIEESRIINKISQNTYKLFIQFKKYSLMSLARWTIVTATVVRIQKKVYLLIRSCEQLTQEELLMGNYMSTVRVKKFYQTIELTQRIQQPEKILMIILTVADYGGYCSKQDNLSMSLQFLNNINNFHHYLLTQAISYEHNQSQQQQGNKSNRLFVIENTSNNDRTKRLQQKYNMTKKSRNLLDLDQSLNSINKTIRKKSQPIGSQMSYDEEDSAIVSGSEVKITHPQSNQAIHFEKQHQFERSQGNSHHRSFTKDISQNQLHNSTHPVDTIIFNEFIKEFFAFQLTQRGTQKLVQLILSKIQQRIYLKHRFQAYQTFNPNAKRYNQDPDSDNWLLQKGKWKMSGNQLIFTNQQILAKQKNVIKLILKQLSSNVMAGKNIMNMSLPVEIFEDRSFLEKLGEVYGLFPYYFNLAAKEKNIVKQITLVSQAFAFATTIQPNIEKPFNPILGETYQCTVGGVSLYFEQVSHHPPVSSFYLKTDEYQSYGSHNPNVDMGLNTAIAKNINPITVHFFETNTTYVGYGQDFQIGGLIFGQRTYKNSGKLNIFEQKNEILCELSYGKNKKHIYESQKKIKTGDIIGGVYKVSNAFTKRFKHAQWKNFEGIKYDEKIQELAKIHGNWMGDFYMDGNKMRGMYDVVPFKPVKEVYVLPSDCSYRLDVFYKKMGDIKKSQEWKEVMQNMQRKDRKLREQYTGHKSH